MAKSLLEKAKEVQAIRTHSANFSDEELELVSAWLADEITLKQMLQVLKLKSTAQPYVFIARGARELWRRANKK